MELSYKLYDYPRCQVFYVTLNGVQILGPHFSKKEVLAKIDSIKSGKRLDKQQ